MYQVNSQDVANYIMSNGRSFRAKIVLNNYTISDGINSITWNIETANSDITPGDTISQSVTIDVTEIPEYDIIGKNFFLYIYAVNFFTELEEELIPCGRFKVEECKRNGNVWTIEGKDGFYKSDDAYTSTLTFPTTTDEIEQEICNQLGILSPRYDYSQLCDKDGQPLLDSEGEQLYVRDSAPVVIDAPLEDCTCREMLSYCASLDGGKCAMLDREGHLIHKAWTDIDYTITAGRADEPQTDNSNITITQISCQVDQNENLIIAATPGRLMSFTNPYMTQSLLSKVASNYLMKPYRPLSIYHRLGDPRLDILDVVTVEKADGTSYRVPIMSMSFTFDGGLGANITATGTPDADNKSSSSPMMRQVSKVVAAAQNATEEKLNAAFQESIDYIVGNEGGYVVTKFNADNQPIATYYTDNLDIEQAKEFLLINNQGIAGGTNGIHGAINTAIDIQGRINAAQILTGILSAIVIQSLNYNEGNKTGSKINLEDGSFDFAGGMLTYKNGTFSINGGQINIETDNEDTSVIKLSHNEWTIELSPLEWKLTNSAINGNVVCQAGGLFLRNDENDTVQILSESGSITTLSNGEVAFNLDSVTKTLNICDGLGNVTTSIDGTNGSITANGSVWADDFLVRTTGGGYVSIKDALGI